MFYFRQSEQRCPDVMATLHSKFFAPHLYGLDYVNCVDINSSNNGFKWPLVAWGSGIAQEYPTQNALVIW